MSDVMMVYMFVVDGLHTAASRRSTRSRARHHRSAQVRSITRRCIHGLLFVLHVSVVCKKFC